jgi:hypothetical protein
MDAVRWIISQVVKVPKQGGAYYFLTAILTTLLAIVVYVVLSQVSKKVKEPPSPVFAVTR